MDNKDERQVIREITAAFTMDASADELLAMKADARRALEILHEGFPSLGDDILSSFAHKVAQLVAFIEATEAGKLSFVLDTTIKSYALAAGHLAGVCNVNESQVSTSRMQNGYL